MKARHKRLLLIALGVASMALACGLILNAFQKNLLFFFSPSQVLQGQAPHGQEFRLGGLVELGSVRRHADGLSLSFVITDTAQRVVVHYRGMLPDLFKEGKGVVAQGKLAANGQFHANEVLAKHDENYMPPPAKNAIEQAK